MEHVMHDYATMHNAFNAVAFLKLLARNATQLADRIENDDAKVFTANDKTLLTMAHLLTRATVLD